MTTEDKVTTEEAKTNAQNSLDAINKIEKKIYQAKGRINVLESMIEVSTSWRSNAGSQEILLDLLGYKWLANIAKKHNITVDEEYSHQNSYYWRIVERRIRADEDNVKEWVLRLESTLKYWKSRYAGAIKKEEKIKNEAKRIARAYLPMISNNTDTNELLYNLLRRAKDFEAFKSVPPPILLKLPEYLYELAISHGSTINLKDLADSLMENEKKSVHHTHKLTAAQKNNFLKIIIERLESATNPYAHGKAIGFLFNFLSNSAVAAYINTLEANMIRSLDNVSKRHAEHMSYRIIRLQNKLKSR